MALQTKFVTDTEIREIFNEHRYFERFQEGEFDFEVTRVGPSPPGAPPGGYSQMVRYRTRGGSRWTVAVVHQRAGDDYGNPCGNDRPDPKRLVHGGTDYRFSPKAR